jgi:hypothetical protein
VRTFALGTEIEVIRICRRQLVRLCVPDNLVFFGRNPDGQRYLRLNALSIPSGIPHGHSHGNDLWPAAPSGKSLHNRRKTVHGSLLVLLQEAVRPA